MTAVFAFLAFLLATLTGHAGSPSAVASPSPLEHVVGHAHAPQVSPAPQRFEEVPARPAAPRSGHAESVPAAADTDAAPTNGEELQGPHMCTDPIACPTS